MFHADNASGSVQLDREPLPGAASAGMHRPPWLVDEASLVYFRLWPEAPMI